MAGITFEKTGDWAIATRILKDLGPRVESAVHQAILQEANFMRKKILDEFREGGPSGKKWQPLSPMTLAVRKLLGNRKTKILMQSGDLRNSIGVVDAGKLGVFVGVQRSKARKGGKSNVNLALTHEFGSTFQVRMTPKMMRLLFAARRAAGLPSDTARASRPKGAPGGSGGHVITIRIPPRPFLGPVFDEYAKPGAIEASVEARVATILAGDLGPPKTSPRT